MAKEFSVLTEQANVIKNEVEDGANTASRVGGMFVDVVEKLKSLGATYAGIATPSTTPGAPDGNVFYFATQAGTYTNFGGKVLEAGLYILLWGGVSWNVTSVMTIEQELGDDENAVVSQKAITQTFEEHEKYAKILSGAEFTLKKRYFKKGNIGESFSGKYLPASSISEVWNCHVFYIPKNCAFKITNIKSDEDTNGLTITDLDGIVTYVLNSEDSIDYENTLNYDAVLFISTRVTSDTKVMLSVDTEQYVSNSDLLFENYFYNTTDWKEGDFVRLQPTAIQTGNWKAGFYEIKKGEVAEFINIYTGERTRNFAVLDSFGKVLHVEALNIYSRYKAEEDGYLVFSMSEENNNYETSRNFAIKNSPFLKKRQGYSWDSIQNQIKEYKYENFSLPYTYYINDFNVEDNFILFPTGVSSQELACHSTVLRLYAGERILFNRIWGVNTDTAKIYVVDPYSFKVIDVITKVGMTDYPAYYTGDYTAEQECLIAFSTTYGSIFAKDIRVEKIESKTAELEHPIPINARNYYLTTSGREVAISDINWFISDFIVIYDWQEKLKFSSSLVETSGNEGAVYHICYYDEKLNFISGSYLKNKYSFIIDNKVEVDIPENAKYYRLSLVNTDYVKIIQNLPVTKALSVISKNCFRNGYYIDSNGRQQNISSGDWKISPFIKLIEGANYFLQARLYGGQALPNVIAYYSSANDDSFISGITKEYIAYNYRDVLTIPEGANYIRFCSNNIDTYYTLYSDTVYDFNDYTTESSNKVDIVVPKYVDIPIGRQTDIFLDGIIAEPDDCKRYPLKINGSTGVNDILQIGDNQLRYTPSEEKELTVYFTKYNDLRLSDINNQGTLIFRSVPKNVVSGREVNICIAGDSLIDGTNAPCEAFRLLNEDADFTVNQIGTRNATMSGQHYKHEGRGSWSWETYVNPIYETQDYPSGQGKTNAFMKNGVLDFQAYMNDNFSSLSRKEIDYFIMALGTNDVTQGTSYPSDTRISTIINAAKTFIDALLSSDKGFPNCKIAIGLPGVGAPSFVGLQSYSSVFKMAIQKLNRAYIDTFDNGKYHANVTCVMHGAYIDRYDGYQHEDVSVNDYTTRTVRRWINQVHPLPAGYKQWGRGYYGKLRAFLDGKL